MVRLRPLVLTRRVQVLTRQRILEHEVRLLELVALHHPERHLAARAETEDRHSQLVDPVAQLDVKETHVLGVDGQTSLGEEVGLA